MKAEQQFSGVPDVSENVFRLLHAPSLYKPSGAPPEIWLGFRFERIV
jgi:hypothetical protein